MLVQAGVHVLGSWVGRVGLPAALEIQEGTAVSGFIVAVWSCPSFHSLIFLLFILQNVWFWPLGIQSRGQCDPSSPEEFPFQEET